MDVHCRQTIYLIEGSTDCCEDFPTCPCEGHVWEVSCPECGEKAHSSEFLGVYTCDSCGSTSFVLVDGWVDKRDGKE